MEDARFFDDEVQSFDAEGNKGRTMNCSLSVLFFSMSCEKLPVFVILF